MSNWNGMLIPLFCGLIIIPGIILFLDYFIRRIDEQHGLPEKVPYTIMIVSGIAGCYLMKRFEILGACFCVLLVFLLIMAWTDYHTRHLYTAFSLLAYLIGMGDLILRTGLIIDYIKFLLLYLLVLSFLMFLRAFARGDIYMVVAASPFLFIYGDHIHISGIMLNLVFTFAAMLLCVIGNLKNLFRRGKQSIPFAPYAAAAFLVLIIIF